VKQGGLFLGAGERYSEVVLLSAAQWGGKGHIVQRLLDFILGQGRGVYAIPTLGLFVPRQKLHGAGAVPSNRREQVNAWSERVLKRVRIRRRISALSGKRLSK